MSCGRVLQAGPPSDAGDMTMCFKTPSSPPLCLASPSLSPWPVAPSRCRPGSHTLARTHALLPADRRRGPQQRDAQRDHPGQRVHARRHDG
eukprot:237396-Chlamydomonas_euryale.AAC.6